MKTVQQQLTQFLAHITQVPPLDVALSDASGCILAADIVATSPIPPMALAACDGYAVRAKDVDGAHQGAPAVLPVAHLVTSALDEPFRLVEFQAIKVSSGVALPIGADAVIPLADTDRGAAKVSILRDARPGWNVLPQGADMQQGDTALHAGTRLGARQLALAAGLGFQRIKVHPRPRVVIVPVGDELIPPGSPRRGIYDSNGPALRTAINDVGAVAIQVAPLPDAPAQLSEAIEDQLVRADLIVTTGGLSEGENDTLKDVLLHLGDVRFDHVAMQPGRNQGFGLLTVQGFDEKDTPTIPVYALPGNPAAAHVAFEVFVRPALRAMAGYTELYRPALSATTTTSWRSPVGVRQFIPAQVTGGPDGGYHVTPVGDPEHLENLTLSLVASANALAVVPEDSTLVTTGQSLPCLILED
ncbi:gephyrin-like molybdotransferase Glp [Jonesia quinghaiensis]|uniref:molybdopterin molybdotransferase MoeA n=1 Tax=Jonesia quinghaiensis TaxID=262806 RepID=UPI0004048C95|nr:gephyrin-like molybdotransferase Glp [Jonesia quinghaiensis]